MSGDAEVLAKLQAWIDDRPANEISDETACRELLDNYRIVRPESPAPENRRGEPLTTHQAPQPASGRFEVKQVIGEGAFGIVFKAFDFQLNQDVAIKVLRPSLGSSRRIVKRFLREADTLAGLTHKNVIRVFDRGHANGSPFLVSELITGPDLSTRIGQLTEPLNADTAAQWIKQVAEGVHFLHSRGVIHRDLKPSNILMKPVEASAAQDPKWIPKIVDFGLAGLFDTGEIQSDTKLTGTAEVLGTIRYMSPEQAAGRKSEIGTASDIFAIGVISYELLVGKKPFDDDSDFEVRTQICSAAPPRPRSVRRGIPRNLEAIILRCLEKRPDRRYASAAELANDLDRFLHREPIIASNHSLLKHAISTIYANPRRAVLAAVLSGTLLAAAATSMQAWRAQQIEARRANENLLLAAQAIGDTLYTMADRINDGLSVSHEDNLSITRDSLEFHQHLADQNPNSIEALHRLQVSHHYVANAYARIGNLDAAINHREASLRLLGQLQKLAPDEARHWFDAFMAHFRLATEKHFLSDTYDRSGVLEHHRWAKHFIEQACKLDPDNVDYADASNALRLELAVNGWPSTANLGELNAVAKESQRLWRTHGNRPLLLKHGIRAMNYLAEHNRQSGDPLSSLNFSERALHLIREAFSAENRGCEIQALEAWSISNCCWAAVELSRWNALLTSAQEGEQAARQGLTCGPSPDIRCHLYEFQRFQELALVRLHREAEAHRLHSELQEEVTLADTLADPRREWLESWENVNLASDDELHALAIHPHAPR